MKTKDKKDLHAKTMGELASLVKELRSEMVTIRLDKLRNKLKNTSSTFRKRKDLARALTVMREKELLEEKK
ncbi:MAG TPA: 50S ribosomal protein L29 [Candidatus Saccharimonadales bacterium]|nr:50S ribosomal protein L29 [Candidatus Saccharimonadales bacterium]